MDQFKIPQGFEDAPREQQRAHIQRLEAIVIRQQAPVPFDDEEREILEKRLAEANAPDADFYHAKEVLDELRS